MITHPVSEFDDNPFDLSAAGHRCFVCGEFLQDPAVLWSGVDGQTIYFHGPCVFRWSEALWRDALELKYADHLCRFPLTQEPQR